MLLSSVGTARLTARVLMVAGLLVGLLMPISTSQAQDGTPFGPGSVEGPARGGKVTPKFFSMGIDVDPYSPVSWPEFQVGAVRMAAPWLWIERTPGVYDWKSMDARVGAAEAHGSRPLLVVHATPSFHATGGSTTPSSPPAFPAYRRFVSALVDRYGDRADYQVWNEPNVTYFFTGTPEHVVKMTKIMSRVVRARTTKSTVAAPSFPLRGEGEYSRDWFKDYWTGRVGGRTVRSLVDVATVSGYPMPDEDPEDGLALTQWTRKTLDKIGFKGELWVTEINYGGNSGNPTKTIPMADQVSYIVRTFVLHATSGGDRVYWFHWTPNVTMNTQVQDADGGLTPAGVAYGVTKDWILKTRATGCETTRGVSTCGFRVNKRVERFVSWTRSGRSRKMVAPVGARRISTPDGESRRVRAGDKVRVGLEPVMIQVRRRR